MSLNYNAKPLAGLVEVNVGQSYEAQTLAGKLEVLGVIVHPMRQKLEVIKISCVSWTSWLVSFQTTVPLKCG
jgi:hypothetical protein